MISWRSLIYTALYIICLAFALLYLRTSWYTWPASDPFSGPVWYDPYAGIDLADKTPLKANFHAHTRSWFGVTYGANSEEEMISAYTARDYDIIGISNYHIISDYLDSSQLFVPVYEHGLNMFKVHNLAIGATEVLLPSFPVHFSLHQTQQMLNRTAAISELNVLCHPTMSGIHPSRLARLTGYSLLEVGNTLGMSLAHWDAALSAGRLVWMLSNDDTHDIVEEPTFIKWNMIYADRPTASSALEALRNGAHYGVESYRGECENTRVVNYGIADDTLVIETEGLVNRIDLYGQDGRQLASVSRSNRIAYPLAPGDTYVRSEVHMDECVYYFNPVVRTATGTPLLASEIPPHVSGLKTWGARFVVVILVAFFAYRLYRESRRKTST